MKILGTNLSTTQAAQIIPSSQRSLLGSSIGKRANMVSMGASRVDNDIVGLTGFNNLVAKHPFCSRGSTNISHANEQNFNFFQFYLPQRNY